MAFYCIPHPISQLRRANVDKLISVVIWHKSQLVCVFLCSHPINSVAPSSHYCLTLMVSTSNGIWGGEEGLAAALAKVAAVLPKAKEQCLQPSLSPSAVFFSGFLQWEEFAGGGVVHLDGWK